MRDDLKAAVEVLYQAFGNVRVIDQVDYCDHCVDPAQVEALRRAPLRQLASEHLGPLLFNAMSTWGELGYFKHFLPRLLELVATGEMEDWSYPTFPPEPPEAMLDNWHAGRASRDCRVPGGVVVGDHFLLAQPLFAARCAADHRRLRAAGSPAPQRVAGAGGRAGSQTLGCFHRGLDGSTRTAEQLWVDVGRWLRWPQPSALLTAVFMDATDPSVAAELGKAEDSLAFYRSWRDAEQTDSLP